MAELEAGITHRMATLVIAGEEAPDYGAGVPARPHGRQRDLAVGRSLADRRPPDRDGVHRGRPGRGRHAASTSCSPDGRTVPRRSTTTRSTTRRRSGRGRERGVRSAVLAEGAGGLAVGARDHGPAAGRGPDGAVRQRVRAVRAALGARGGRPGAAHGRRAGRRRHQAAGGGVAADRRRARRRGDGVPGTLPVLGLDGALAVAAAAADERGVAAIVGSGCVRGLPYMQAARRARGGPIAALAWPGLVELVESGRAPPDPRAPRWCRRASRRCARSRTSPSSRWPAPTLRPSRRTCTRRRATCTWWTAHPSWPSGRARRSCAPASSPAGAAGAAAS